MLFGTEGPVLLGSAVHIRVEGFRVLVTDVDTKSLQLPNPKLQHLGQMKSQQGRV